MIMDSEIILRKQAIELYLTGIPIVEIAQKVERSRQWVHKWINRYRSIGGDDWYKSKSNSPNHVHRKTPQKAEELVVKIRSSLQERLYSQTGALSIMYEIKRLGFEPPSLSTINRILRRNSLISKNKVKQRKAIDYPSYFTLVQQMDMVGPRYLVGGSRFYFLNIIDTENHYVGIFPIKDKRSITIARTYARYWATYGIPDYLQMDNELPFRGSNRYPRSLGIVLRLALSQGVTPIFIPPSEPWRNGVIEKFNFTLYKYFFSAHRFSSFEDVEKKAIEFANFHNKNHRYSTQGGRYPEQIKSASQSHKLDLRVLDDQIPLAGGSVIFIRLIRSDRKLNILRTSFTVKKELVYSYVVAEILIEHHVLQVKQDGIIHHVYPFKMPVE
jgi:transposase InsO family protein